MSVGFPNVDLPGSDRNGFSSGLGNNADAIIDADFFESAPITSGSGLKVYDGSSWLSKPLKRWNGSAWVLATLKRWNGSAWVLVGL